MSHACTPILVGVTSPVSEILLHVLLKTANFPIRTMGYSPWSLKNLIDWNRPKKFMQIGMDVTCILANFGGCDLSGFRDIVTLKTANFPFRTMGYNIVHGHQKI